MPVTWNEKGCFSNSNSYDKMIMVIIDKVYGGIVSQHGLFYSY